MLGAARLKEKRKTKDEVHECGKRGYVSGWSVRKGYGEQEKLETADLLWRPLMGAAERKRRKKKKTDFLTI